jgi:hypothetical protein
MNHVGFAVVAALIFMIPVLAVVGGIVGGILKARGRLRLMELVQRERIAAIERGIDPSKLSPLPVLDVDFQKIAALLPTNKQKAQGFLITGVVLLGCSIGLTLMLLLLPDPRANSAWAAGMMPLAIAVALLVAALIVRRTPDDDRTGGPRA